MNLKLKRTPGIYLAGFMGSGKSTIGALLRDAQKVFDVVLIDCPPGLSVLTESWLREAALHLSPTKPDYVSICGLEVFRRFKALNPEMGFAENRGVVINMKDRLSAADEEYHRWLRENADNRCCAAWSRRSTRKRSARSPWCAATRRKPSICRRSTTSTTTATW